MIKVFNTIREKLISEKKFSNYLLYALGEIFLVVVGILIALEINNANALREANDFELKMLTEVRTALKEDFNFFTNHLIGYRNKTNRKANLFFEKILVTNQIDEDSLDYYFERLDFGVQVTYNRGPYEALKATGLDKISNDSLRNRLIYVYDFIYPRYKTLIGYDNSYRDEDIKNLKLELTTQGNYSIENDSVIWNPNALRKDIDFKTNTTFLTLLEITSKKASLVEKELKRVPKFIKKLIEQITIELEKRQ